MQGSEMRRLRERLLMNQIEFARLIGYTGTDRNNETRVRHYENGKYQIPLYLARLLWLVERHCVWFGRLPDFPSWPGYDFDHKPDPQHQKEPTDVT